MYLRVAGPAQPLVPLRAVRGHIQEIAPLAPEGILRQPVQFFMAGVYPQGFPQIRGQADCCEILRIRLIQSFNLRISESKEGEQRFHFFFDAVGSVDEFRFCRTQIIPVEVSLLQHFTGPDTEGSAPGKPVDETDDTGHILAEIQHLLPGRRADQYRFAFRPGPDAGRKLRLDPVCCFDRATGDGISRLPGIIPDFPVIDPAGQNRGRGGKPAFIRQDFKHLPVIQRDLQPG